MRIHEPPPLARELVVLTTESMVDFAHGVEHSQTIIRQWMALDRQLRKTGHGAYPAPALVWWGRTMLAWELRHCRRRPGLLKGQPVWILVDWDQKSWEIHWRYAAGAVDYARARWIQGLVYFRRVLPGARVPVVSGLHAVSTSRLARAGTVVQAARGTWRYVPDASA